MALRRLPLKVATFCTLFLLPPMMHAQAGYQIVHTHSITDITAQATSGTNAWKALTSLHFQLNSLAVSPNMTAWLAGTDNTVYNYNPVTKTWTPHPEIGSVTGAIGIGPSNHVYFLKSDSACTAWAPDLRLFEWNGTSLVPKNGCFANFSVTLEGVIYGVSSHGSVPTSLWYSTDDGSTFTQWAPTGWKYAHMSSGGSGCAIDTSGHIYGISPQQNTSLLARPDISGTAVGCIDQGQGDAVTIAWNSAGSVYLLNTSTLVWNQISGLVANQVDGLDKGDVLALDATGIPYHWNVYAPTITATITGTFDNFPMNLNPTPHHTSHIKINYPHGLNNASASVQTIPYNGAMNNSYTDTGSLCDIYWVGEDSECQPVTSDDATCTEAGALAVAAAANVTYGESIQNVKWDGFNSYNGPTNTTVSGVVGKWNGIVRSNISDICSQTGGTSTCDSTTEALKSEDNCYYFNAIDNAACEGKIQVFMQEVIAGDPSPWSIYVTYAMENGVVMKCFKPGKAVGYWGNPYWMLPCQ